jgi:hypothetical protein
MDADFVAGRRLLERGARVPRAAERARDARAGARADGALLADYTLLRAVEACARWVGGRDGGAAAATTRRSPSWSSRARPEALRDESRPRARGIRAAYDARDRRDSIAGDRALTPAQAPRRRVDGPGGGARAARRVPGCHTQYDVSQLLTRAAHLPLRRDDREPRAAPGRTRVIARCGSCGAQVAARRAACAYCDSAIVRDPGKLSLICPECFARNAEQSRFCVACGIAFSPAAAAERRHGAALPGLRRAHAAEPGRGHRRERVPRCHGLWVSANTSTRS